MKNKPLVSILIVNWNGKKHLKEVLSSIKKNTYRNYEVIIVDQGSDDGSVSYIKKGHPYVKLVETKENLGFAGGNNVGVKYARGKYILFLNNDTKLEPDLLTYLVRAIAEKGVGVVQPKILFYDGAEIQSTGSFLTKSGFLFHRGYGAPRDSYNEPDYIFSANGSSMLVRRALIERIGLFDEDFFAYFEESDFCWRAWNAGYKVKYEPRAVVYHKGGQTSKALANDFVQFHSFKNRICSILKNSQGMEIFYMTFLNIFFSEIAFLAFLLTGKLRNSLAVQRAVLWNAFNLDNTLKKRGLVNIKKSASWKKFMRENIYDNPPLIYYYYLFSDLRNYEKAKNS